MPRISIDAAAEHPTRYRHYRAPDPVWADKALLERIRLKLVSIDPRLNLWWNPNWKDDDREQPGRWAVMYWLERTGCWSVVFYHEGPAGEFRPLGPECIGQLVHRLKACEEDAKVAFDRVERAAKERRELQREKLARALHDHSSDVMQRLFGVRQTFGRGANRKRRRIQARIEEAGRTADRIRAEHEKDAQAQADRIRAARIKREFGS